MQKANKVRRPARPDRHVIGRDAAIKLTEIEGLEFTDEMRAAFDSLYAAKVSTEQRQAFLAAMIASFFGREDEIARLL
jgi:hypothetical protein